MIGPFSAQEDQNTQARLVVGRCTDHASFTRNHGIPHDGSGDEPHMGHFQLVFPDGGLALGYILEDDTYQVDQVTSAYMAGLHKSHDHRHASDGPSDQQVIRLSEDQLPPDLKKALAEILDEAEEEDEDGKGELRTGMYL